MRRRGFTVLEMLIALAVMFVGLLGLVALQITAARASSASREITEATGLAQDKVEALGHTAFDRLADSTESGLGPQGPPAIGQPAGRYARTATVVRNGLSAAVTVRVAWNDGDGRAHAVTLQTVRTP